MGPEQQLPFLVSARIFPIFELHNSPENNAAVLLERFCFYTTVIASTGFTCTVTLMAPPSRLSLRGPDVSLIRLPLFSTPRTRPKVDSLTFIDHAAAPPPASPGIFSFPFSGFSLVLSLPRLEKSTPPSPFSQSVSPASPAVSPTS